MKSAMERISTESEFAQRTSQTSDQCFQIHPSLRRHLSSESSCSRKVIKYHCSRDIAMPNKIVMFFPPVVNGERAAYHSQKLSKGIKRTVGMFLKELFDQYLQDPQRFNLANVLLPIDLNSLLCYNSSQTKGTKTTPRKSKLLSGLNGLKRGKSQPRSLFTLGSLNVSNYYKQVIQVQACPLLAVSLIVPFFTLQFSY